MLSWLRKLFNEPAPHGAAMLQRDMAPCAGCNEAEQRIKNGEFSTICHQCGCMWMNKLESEKYRLRTPKLTAKAEINRQLGRDLIEAERKANERI